MSCEAEKGVFPGESKGISDDLRMQIKSMDDHQNLEPARIGNRLSRVMCELHAAQGDILSLEEQVLAAEDAKLIALAKVEATESALSEERLKSEELKRMNDTISHLMRANEEKAVELELKEANSQEKIVFLKRQIEEMQNIEKELLEKNAILETLKMEIGQTKEFNITCENIASDTIAELKKVKEEMELQEKKNWNQFRYINLLEAELKKQIEEANKSRDEVATMNDNLEKMKAEMDEFRTEAAHSRDRVLESQVENALLKVELHKWRSKAAAAEAAEARSTSEKTALNRALRLAVVSHDTRQENGDSWFSKQRGGGLPQQSDSSEQKQTETKATDTNNVTIPRKEYEALIDKMDSAAGEELEKLRRELVAAKHKTAGFRTRAEQAISRAEAAEKAKAELESKLKRKKENQKERKQVFAAIREELISLEVEQTPAIQQLGEVLQISL